MTASREDVVVKVREWAAHADDDMRVAQHTLTLHDACPYRLVAYHAQQCAEKYLKAFLVLRGVDFPSRTTSHGCWSYAPNMQAGPTRSRMPRNLHPSLLRPGIQVTTNP